MNLAWRKRRPRPYLPPVFLPAGYVPPSAAITSPTAMPDNLAPMRPTCRVDLTEFDPVTGHRAGCIGPKDRGLCRCAADLFAAVRDLMPPTPPLEDLLKDTEFESWL